VLVILPYGVAVDPDIVKLIAVRVDRPQGRGAQAPLIFSVGMKTDADERMHILGSFDNRAEAEELARVCARRVNKAMGEDADQSYDDYEGDGPKKGSVADDLSSLLD